MAKHAWIGVDIGGTKVAVALINVEGEILAEHTIPTSVEKGPDYTLDHIFQLIDELMAETAYTIKGIGVGSPGPVDAKQGLIMSPSNLLTWQQFPITDKIEERYHIKTVLGNDADLAGLAEYRYGLSDQHENVVYVTVSTGVGGGIIARNKLYTGNGLCQGEFGHMTVVPNGPVCGCGKRGCLETFSSGTGIANRMIEKVLEDKQHALFDVAQKDELTAKEVFTAYEQGDPAAVAVIENAVDYLGMSLGNMVSVFGPSVFVMGGGVILKQPAFFEKVKAKIAEHAMPENMDYVRFELAQFAENAGVLGAAALSMQETE